MWHEFISCHFFYSVSCDTYTGLLGQLSLLSHDELGLSLPPVVSHTCVMQSVALCHAKHPVVSAKHAISSSRYSSDTTHNS
ncbi:MAG: hypothetical protein IJW31_05000 [Lentisphaeria bacterium]|nr:hypothetical protein [Lentisphaeria bacterium]